MSATLRILFFFFSLFDLLCSYLGYFRNRRVDAVRILAAGLGHARPAAAATAYKACNSLDQVSGMRALLLGSDCSRRHQPYLAVYGACQHDNAFAQLLLQLVTQIPQTVHIHAVYSGCQNLDAANLLYLIHHVAQSILRHLAL